MSQTTSTNYDEAMADPHKPWDFILALGGWPTLYSVAKSSYTLAGDLTDFDEIKQWANLPVSTDVKCKGIPEGGESTLAGTTIVVQDKFGGGGLQELTDLISRQSYLLGEQSTNQTALDGNLSISATTITVDDTTGFASSGRIYIGRECIAYSGTTSTTFTGCTRGSLLTDAQAHRDNVAVYDFLPTIEQIPAYIYKGTRNLALSDWLVYFPGVLESAIKSGPTVEFSLVDVRWETWGRNGARLMASPRLNSDTFPSEYVALGEDLLPYDHVRMPASVPLAGNLNNGHYIVQIGNEIIALRGVT